jgi:hypothetical protein
MTKRAITTPLLQLYFFPPNWIANSKQTSEVPMRKKLEGSGSTSLLLHVEALLTGGGHFGVSSAMSTTERKPRGRLTQKHQRHDTNVREPPRTGPRIDDIPRTEPRLPKYFGRSGGGTRNPINNKDPGGTATPPVPVITLRTIKAVEFRADVHTMEPISKTRMLAIMTHLTE